MPGAGQGRIYGAEKLTINLNSLEAERLAEFLVEHRACLSADDGTILVESVATGVGSHLSVSCSACTTAKAFADVESW